MSASQELIEAVRARAAETPYGVIPTERGFDLDIEIVDATWYSVMYKQGLRRAWTYQVELEEADKTMRITDVVKDVTWKGGASLDDGTPVPQFSVSASGAKGRFEQKSFRKTYGVSERGEYEKVVDYRFDAAEGRDLIRGVARELGWQERAGGAQKVGLAVGTGAVVLAVVIVVLLLVVL